MKNQGSHSNHINSKKRIKICLGSQLLEQLDANITHRGMENSLLSQIVAGFFLLGRVLQALGSLVDDINGL